MEVNLISCGLDANCFSSAFLLEGDLWQDGSLYLVEDESLGGILLMELHVNEEEGMQELDELDYFDFDFETFAELIK